MLRFWLAALLADSSSWYRVGNLEARDAAESNSKESRTTFDERRMQSQGSWVKINQVAVIAPEICAQTIRKLGVTKCEKMIESRNGRK